MRKDSLMNLLSICLRMMVLGMIALIHPIKSRPLLHRNSDKIAVILGSLFVDEKRTNVVMRDTISPRNRVILGKALAGGVGHLIKHHQNTNEDLISDILTGNVGFEPYFTYTENSTRYAHTAGYVVTNGTLRVLGNKFFLDEEFVDKKCDDILPEGVAWLVKPVARGAIDLAYDYVTVECLKGIFSGINQSE